MLVVYLLLAVKRKRANSPFVLLLNLPSLSPTKEEKGRTVVSHVVMMMMMRIIMVMIMIMMMLMALMMLKRVVMVGQVGPLSMTAGKVEPVSALSL